MPRIFKYFEDDPDRGLKCVAGEMLNLEYGKRMWRCENWIETKHKPYPRIKMDTCKVVPNLTIGFIYISSGSLDKFQQTITNIINKMVEDKMKSHKNIKLYENSSAYCSIEIPTNLSRVFVDINKIRNTNSFQWVILRFPQDYIITTSISHLSTIIYDADNICKWEHDTIYFDGIKSNDLRLFDSINATYLEKCVRWSTYIEKYPLDIIKRIFITNHTYSMVDIHEWYLSNRFTDTVNNNLVSEIRSILVLSWNDAKKFNIYSPMAMIPSVDTRYGYKLDYPTNDMQDVLHNEIKYDDEIRYNICACCGFQLYEDIYGIPVEYMKGQTILKKFEHNKIEYSTLQYGNDTPNTILLICVSCMHRTHRYRVRTNDINISIFRIKHPMTFKNFTKSLYGHLNTDLIKLIRRADTIDTFYDHKPIHIISYKNDKCLCVKSENSYDVMNLYTIIKNILKQTTESGGEFRLYIQNMYRLTNRIQKI